MLYYLPVKKYTRWEISCYLSQTKCCSSNLCDIEWIVKFDTIKQNVVPATEHQQLLKPPSMPSARVNWQCQARV